jgi:transcriptional regulator with XRE-family HTH domain
MKTKRSTFGKNLMKIRKQRGLSQDKLAALSGLTQRKINYYENDAHKIPIDNIEALSKVLDVNVNELVGINETTETQKELLNLDARTIRKIKKLISLPNHQRHIIYTMAESFLKQNEEQK